MQPLGSFICVRARRLGVLGSMLVALFVVQIRSEGRKDSVGKLKYWMHRTGLIGALLMLARTPDPRGFHGILSPLLLNQVCLTLGLCWIALLLMR